MLPNEVQEIRTDQIHVTVVLSGYIRLLKTMSPWSSERQRNNENSEINLK